MELIKDVIDKVASPISSWPRLETYTLLYKELNTMDMIKGVIDKVASRKLAVMTTNGWPL